MRFENTTDRNVLLRETVGEDGYVYAEVWDQPNSKKVEMSSEPTYVGPGSATWVTHLKITEDGEVVFDDVFHTDTYYALETDYGQVVSPMSFTLASADP